jgi:hypothetical protein
MDYLFVIACARETVITQKRAKVKPFTPGFDDELADVVHSDTVDAVAVPVIASGSHKLRVSLVDQRVRL